VSHSIRCRGLARNAALLALVAVCAAGPRAGAEVRTYVKDVEMSASNRRSGFRAAKCFVWATGLASASSAAIMSCATPVLTRSSTFRDAIC